MTTNDLNTLEAIENFDDADLFADELEEHYSHAAGVSTLGCISTMLVCVCTFSTACTGYADDTLDPVDVPVDSPTA
jgi:hypothetical protein